MRKKIVAVLLGLSCLMSGFILALTPAEAIKAIENFSQLDTLINQQIRSAGINEGQIRTYAIQIDTAFTRKRYRLEVPPGFSKTSFHFKLHQLLIDFEIKSPAKVHLPEQNMTIYLLYKDTVIRTIELRTQTDIPSPSISATTDGN